METKVKILYESYNEPGLINERIWSDFLMDN